MDVCLTPALIEFVDREVESGLYETAGEVVRAGLRRLKEEKERQPDVETALPAEWARRPVRRVGGTAAEQTSVKPRNWRLESRKFNSGVAPPVGKE